MVIDIRQLTTLCVMHQPAHCSPRHVWTDRQQWPTTLSFAHPFEQRLKDNPLFLVLQPYPAITVSKPPIGLRHPNYWDVRADGAADNTDTDTDTDIHQLTFQFLESANAVADNLSLRLSPPATQSNRSITPHCSKYHLGIAL
ncbi:hypothetical protein BASA60_000532 [Batrachochytrium salamandrivorans]|nr:hypothetical protein BASA60_000532 [Batrachochytrium salamandrivorans]